MVFDGAATFQGLSLNDAVFPGVNLLYDLVGVLNRFRLGRFACMADLRKCFFQVALPREQQDWFRLVRFKDNEIDTGKTQIYRFTRHVWGINSSPCIALFAIERLIDKNPTCASQLTLTWIESKRYIDDVLLSFDSFDDLKPVTQESKALFESRGFKLRKWVANIVSKSVLLNLPPEDLGANVKEIDLTSQLMPDFNALGLVWDVEGDRLRVCSRCKLVDVSTRREMLSVLASQYDPLVFLAPCFLGGKLILQKVTSSGLGWDEILPSDVLSSWISWAASVEPFLGYFVPRCCFPEDGAEIEKSKVSYQLFGRVPLGIVVGCIFETSS